MSAWGTPRAQEAVGAGDSQGHPRLALWLPTAVTGCQPASQPMKAGRLGSPTPGRGHAGGRTAGPWRREGPGKGRKL